MNILVTGAHGLLGQKLMFLLSQQENVALTGTVRSKGTTALPAMDITSASQTAEVIDLARPDVVIHAAAMTQVDQCETDRELCWENNVKGVENVAEAAAQAGAHLLFLSTDFIFDGTKGPLAETATPCPVNYYGQCKWEAEKRVQQYPHSWAIARTVLVYGFTPGLNRSNIVLWVKKSLEEKKPIKVVDDQWRTPTLAEDLAMGCWLMAKNQAEGIYHISGEAMMSPYQIALQVADFFGLDKSLISKIPSASLGQAAMRPPKTGFDISKAKSKLGYTPHSFEEGLALMAKQMK